MSESSTISQHRPASLGLSVFLVVFLWAVMYLPGLGSLELRGEEGRRVLPGVEMLKSGNWILPEVGGRPYLNKPPLINWLAAGSMKLLGQRSEFAARLPSALSILAFVLIWLVWPNRAFSLEERLISVLLFLTCISIIVKGQQMEMEGPYVVLTGLALGFWLRRAPVSGSSWSAWLGTSAFLAAGMMLKGPMILLLFYVPVVFVLHARKRLRGLLHPAHALAIVVWAGPFLIWSSLAAGQVQAQEMVGTWSEQMWIRLVPKYWDWSERVTAWWRSAECLLPWLLFAPLLWRKAVLQEMGDDQIRVFKALRNSWLVTVLFVTFMPGSIGRYVMPAIPLLCILLSRVILIYHRQMSTGYHQRMMWILGLLYTLLPVTTVVLAIKWGVRLWTAELMGLSLVGVAGFWWLRKRIGTGFQIMVVCGVLLGLIAANVNFALTRIRLEDQPGRYWGRQVSDLVPADETLYVYDPGNQTLMFYLREPIRYLVEPEQIGESVRYVLVRTEQLEADAQLAHHLDTRSRKTLLGFKYKPNQPQFVLLSLN